LNSGFAVAVVAGGYQRLGEAVWLAGNDVKFHQAEIVKPVFVDPVGARQNV